MNPNQHRQSRIMCNWTIAALGTAFAGILLIACSTSSTPTPEKNPLVAASAASPTSLPESTSTLIPGVPTLPSQAEMEATDEAAETSIARNAAAVQTDAALTPHSTIPTAPFYIESPIPTPTWRVGYFGGSIPDNPYQPQYVSCWAGYLNVNPLEICSGNEELEGDSQQGVLHIRVWEPDQVTVVSDGLYQTPDAFGPMHIVVADSNSVTIASEDGQHIYTFDIATRQWVPNPPMPTPSVSPLSSPSASP
jgi:hypothetical protein